MYYDYFKNIIFKNILFIYLCGTMDEMNKRKKNIVFIFNCLKRWKNE